MCVHEGGAEEGEEELPHLCAPLHVSPPDLRQQGLGRLTHYQRTTTHYQRTINKTDSTNVFIQQKLHPKHTGAGEEVAVSNQSLG